MNGTPESKPSAPGFYYGQISSGGQWFWNGTGLPGDAWIAWIPSPSTAQFDLSVEAAAANPPYPPPFPTWPPSSGGYPVTTPELGPILNPIPYGSTQTGNISTSPPPPSHPYPSTFFPKKMPVGANGQNQGASNQLPPMTKNWEIGPIAAPKTLSAISPAPIMGPGPQGTPPY
jgi:hypothetical protein